MCPPSIYVLELSVEPGGARKHVMYVCNSLEEVVAYLKEDLESDAYLSIWYGQTVRLHTCSVLTRYERDGYDFYASSLFKPTNLLQHVTYHVGQFKPITFDSEGKPQGMIEDEDGVDEDAPVDFTKQDPDEISKYLWNDPEPDVRVDINLAKFPKIRDDFQFKLEENKWAKVIFRSNDQSVKDRTYDVKYGMNTFE
jgi:hypothetical protein